MSKYLKKEKKKKKTIISVFDFYELPVKNLLIMIMENFKKGISHRKFYKILSLKPIIFTVRKIR